MALTLEQLRAIKKLEKSDGGLTTDAVITAARKPEHPLHNEFNWNVEEAALEHWRQKARTLIEEYRITIATKHTHIKIEAPAYVKDPRKASGYKSTTSMRAKSEEYLPALMTKTSYCISHLETLYSLTEMWHIDSTKIKNALVLTREFMEELELKMQARPSEDAA